MALKLTYGSPEQRLAVESRMLCAPGSVWRKSQPVPLLCEETAVIFNNDVVVGPAICNATHMTVAIPAFPGVLMAVDVENKTIPTDQLQENWIVLDTKRGVKLHISRGVLKSRVSSDSQVTGAGVVAAPWCLLRTRAP